eukprot:759303-Hanusia_phi.AAC.1
MSSTSLHPACQSLFSHFESCGDDIAMITRILEEDFQKEGSYSKAIKVLERLRALKEDLPKVQEDWKRVMLARQKLLDSAKQQQLSMNRTLKQMCQSADVPLACTDSQDIFSNFSSRLNDWSRENMKRYESMRNDITLIASEELDMEVLTTMRTQMAVDEVPVEDVCEDKGPEGGYQENENPNGSPCVAAPAEAAKQQKPSHYITEEEFLSVSNVVRGRCKLEECNTLLDVISAHCRKTKSSHPISTVELVKIGARVTGQTGGSRLATLRSLKRIEISKDGVQLSSKWFPR